MFEIIFEDNDFIVINKEHGVPVVRDCKDIGRKCLSDLLMEKYSEIYMVHRLDAGTSGLMIWAKSRKYQKFLSGLFETGKIVKKYKALVKGRFENPLSCFLPISKKNYHGKYKIDWENGRKCRTTFYPMEIREKTTLLDVILYTGRSHQIRVHLKALGFPLFMDYQYNRNTPHNVRDLSLQCAEIIFFDTYKNIEFKFSLKNIL